MRAAPVSALLTTPLLLVLIAPRPASAAWPTFGRAIAVAPGGQLGPAITTDGADGAIVTWNDRRRFPFNIDAQHLLASGEVDPAWPANGRALLTDALVQTIVPQGVEVPAIVSDGAGGAIVTWPDARNALSGLDVFAHHILASGTPDPTWPINGVVVCAAGGAQNNPVLVADGAGGAIVAWVDGRDAATVNSLDVYAQHVLASGRVDPAWPVNGTPLCTAPRAQIGLAIVGDGGVPTAGGSGAFVTWTDTRSGNPGSDIFAEHVLSSGAVDPAWPVNGLGLCTAPGTQSLPRMIPDGVQGAIVTWTDARNGENHIFAQRVTRSGTIATGWPLNGQAVSITGVDEVGSTLVADGAGAAQGGSGAIVVWGDASTGHHNMRAKHLLASGVLDPAWPVNGTSLSFAPGEETFQVMASDGAGGAIVAWQGSFDATQFDIFAQHVLASGALDPAYPVNGRAVCALLGLQEEPDIVAAGAGGAIVTWMDTRDDDAADVYALQVLEAATADVDPGAAPHEITFARPSPNPAQGPITLRFALPHAARMRLDIYDTNGRRVRQLGSSTRPVGEHAIAWDLRDESGRAVRAGLYFARLEVDGLVLTQKVATLR
jgi:hypothetical protein